MEPLGTGAIYAKDVNDYKYLASGVLPETLPATYKTDTSMFPVLMQGQRPSCVSHAWVRLLQLYHWKKTGEVVNFSPRFLHALTSPGMGDADGRDPRVVGNALVNVGCCTTDLLPNDITLSDREYSRVTITQAMIDEAKKYKIPAYSFPPLTKYGIRHAIYHRGAVGLMFNVGNEWYTPSWLPRDINPLRPPNPKTGQHEVAGTHWSDGVSLSLEGIQNSWSAAWNQGGSGEYIFNQYTPLQVICIDDPSVDFNPTGFSFNKDLWFGMTNGDVLQLQKRLGVIQTSYFGTLTRAAVKKYQTAHNIPSTGYVGVLTRASLNSTL